MAHLFASLPKRAASRRSLSGHGGHTIGFCLLVFVISLSSFMSSGPRAWAAEGSGERDEREVRPARATVVDSVPGGAPEKLLIEYNEFMKGSGAGLSGSAGGELGDADYARLRDFVQKLYTEAARGGGSAHKKVALLISNTLDEPATSEAFNQAGHEHRQIGDDMSVLMAQTRDRMIEEAIVEVLEKHRAEGWEVARSDSGNPKSGMRSDLDQTFYLFKTDPESGALVRDETLDSQFIEEFRGAWESKFGALKLDMLDVVSIEGKNRFPDPRAFAVHEFGKAYLGTIAELRNIEGAYSTYGAVLQQVQKRQLAALMDPQNQRVWQQYGKMGQGEDAGLGKLAQPDLDLAQRSIFYATPELLPDSAFGAAVANYFELQHYMNAAKFNTKYHLRTFDDSLFSRFLMENFQRMKDKVDYLDMSSNQRNTYGLEMLKRLFPGDTPEMASKRQAHLLALEISRDMRLEHVAETPEDLMKVEAYQKHGSVPATDFQKKAVMFEALARHMFGDKCRPGETGAPAERRLKSQIEAAEAYHRKLASEFCLETIHNTGADNFKLLMNPDLANRCRYLLEVDSGNWDTVKSNILGSSKMTMLFALYDLGMVDGARMLQRFDIELPGNRWQLFKLYAEAQFMPIRAAIANPDAYVRAYAPRVEALAGRVRFYLLDQIGFEKIGEAEAVDAALAEQRLVWNWRKVAKSMFWDLGALGSLGQISETYFVSKGDMDQILKKIADEIFLAIPLVGQAENIRRGGVTTAALIGAAIYYPPVAKIMVAYTIGKSFYTIYQVEAGIPTQGNIEDAVYRGFAGPETVAYGEIGKPPPVFTDADYARLAKLEKELADARALIPPSPMYIRDPALRAEMNREYRRQRAEAEKKYKAVEDRLKPQIDDLRRRKIEFEQYRDGTWAGGYFTEAGAVKTQQWVSHSLLERVEPIYAFLPGGVVDFRVTHYDPSDPNERNARPFDLDEAEARLKELDGIIASSTSVEEQIAASAERAELNLRKERYERAQRYLERSRVNKELACRIKRDSLFRWCQENRVNINKHVDEFAKEYGKVLFDELEKIGLVTRYEATNIGADDGFVTDDAIEVINEMRNRIAPWTIENLKKRMTEDWERSRALTATYLRNEKGRRAKNAENIEKARDLFMNEAFGLAVEKLKDDKQFMEYLAALRFSAVKRMKPRISATLFKIARDSRDLRKGAAGEPITEQFELSAAVDIFADETLYLQPYTVKTSVLKVSGDSDVTLTAEAQKEVEAIKSERAEELGKGAGLIGVVSVYATGLANVEGALPETLAGLPGFEGGAAQSGEVLMGQQVGFVPVNPISVKVDPIRVQVVDQAGMPIRGQAGLVTVDGNDAMVSGDEYWTAHEFTKYGEKLAIAGRYRLPDGRELSAAAEFGVDDVENWLDPQPPKEPIMLRLPVFMPGSFRCKGVVSAEKPDPNSPYPGYATVRNEYLNVDKGLYIPGGTLRTSIIGEAVASVFGRGDEDTPKDGSFNVLLDGPLTAGESVTLSFEGDTDRHFFSAVKSVPLPAAPGVIDFGQVTLRVDETPVRVPDWNQQEPPDFQSYAGRLASVHLRGRPKLGKPSPAERLQYKIFTTDPGAGALVPKGSEVAVILHDKYARKVPDVVGLKIEQAREFLADQGFTARDVQGENAPSRAKESTVVSQSVAPGTEHRPDVPIRLTVYAKYVPSCEVPKLAGMTEEKAKEVTKKAQVTLEVVDRAMEPQRSEDIDRIYKQEPEPGTRVEEGQPVKVWIYAGVDEPETGPSGPFYVTFQIFLPDLENSDVPEFRDQGENESDEAYKKAALQYLNSINAEAILFKPVDVNQSVLAFHVNNEALKKYPRKDFDTGTKHACGIYIKGKNKKTEKVHEITGALLLKTLGTYDEMSEVLATWPSLKSRKELQAIPFTTAEGVFEQTADGGRFRLGPITPDWTLDDITESVRFLIHIGLLVTCYTATVAYDDPLAEEVEILRDFRDDVMAQTPSGRHLIELYYQHGPTLALLAMEHPELRATIKIGLDHLVRLLENTDTGDAPVRASLNAVLRHIDGVLSVLLGERESMVDEFRRVYIRRHKMPVGIGASGTGP